MPTLTVESGPLEGQSFSFDTHAVVGRGQIADIRIDDGTISRRHCEIRVNGTGWEIIDFESANGTSVNGKRVEKPAPLASGDHLKLGQVALHFAAAPSADAATATGGTQVALPDVLQRLKLFSELGTLVAAADPNATHLGTALRAIHHALPRLERVVLLRYASTADRFTGAAGSAGRERQEFDPATLFPFAREALRHERGLVVTIADCAARNEPEMRADRAGLPIRHAGETLGVLYLEGLADANALRAGHRDTLFAIAGLVGCLVAPARDTARDVQSAARDLALARRIQQRFLPQDPPTLPGYDLRDSYTAARVIGGDHFDYLTLADGRTAVVVADVSGKAVSGSLYMARVGLMLKYASPSIEDVSTLLDVLNRALYMELEAGMFVTMIVYALDPATGELELGSAGHPLALKRDTKGEVTTVEIPAGPPLGAMPDAEFHSSRLVLKPGECMLAYSDGLDEAHDKTQSLFGTQRIVTAMQTAPTAPEMIAALLTALGDFVGEEPQSDDLTLVVLERKA